MEKYDVTDVIEIRKHFQKVIVSDKVADAMKRAIGSLLQGCDAVLAVDYLMSLDASTEEK